MAISGTLGVGLDDNSIRILQRDTGEQVFSITKFFALDFSSLEEERPRLLSAIKRLGFDNKNVVLFVPRSKFSVHYVSLPTKDPRELREMAKFRAKRQLFYSKEEILHAFRILESNEENATRIMLVVVRRDVVDNYLKLLAGLKFHPFMITLSSLGLANWYDLKNLDKNKDICVVDLDRKSTDICILHKGNFVFSRQVNKGLDIFENSSEKITELVSELQYSLAAYDKEEIGPAIKEILVTGAIKGINKLADSLRRELGLEVSSLSAFEGVNFSSAIQRDISEQAQNVSFAKVMGSFASLDKFEINLRAQEPSEKKTIFTFYRSLYQTKAIYALLGLWLFATACFIAGWEIYRQNSYAAKLRKQNRAVKKRIERIRTRQKAVDLTLAHLNRKGAFLEVFKEIASLLPPGISLRRLSYRYKKKEVILDGRAASSWDITHLMEGLQDSALFKTAKQKYVRAKGNEGNTFQIVISLK